jgi:hypothetical protein
MTEHIIWSNENLDLDDWREDLLADHPGASEDELYAMMVDLNGDYLGDERMNLNIQLTQSILVVADLGRWNDRFSGYREITSGNIKDCLHLGNSEEYGTFYVDELGDLRSRGIHHDGTNHYLYRVWKDGVRDTQKENLMGKILDGKASRKDITRLTAKLGPHISAVYGWKG